MISNKTETDPRWKSLFYIAGYAAIYMIVVIPIQGFFFILSPPPDTVLGFYELFQHHIFTGFVHLDLLLTIDYVLVLFIYFALFIVLSRREKTLSLIAIVLGCLGITLYIVSREGTFSMLALSNEYFNAGTEVERTAILSAGKTLLTIFNGSSFELSYVLGGMTMMFFSIAMLKDEAFKKRIPITGLIMSIMMLVPPTVGEFGIWISMISLIPTILWLVFISVWFFRTAKSLVN
jgi:hypothetical protein